MKTVQQLPEQAHGHVMNMMKQTRSLLSEMQPNKPGTVPRGTRERNALWKRLKSLDKPELQAIMEAMAERAGHAPNEDKPCELCKFLMDQMGN